MTEATLVRARVATVHGAAANVPAQFLRLPPPAPEISNTADSKNVMNRGGLRDCCPYELLLLGRITISPRPEPKIGLVEVLSSPKWVRPGKPPVK